MIELSGGNDGLNTVVPYGDPAYYRARPTLGIPERERHQGRADGFGFHPSMVGFERLYKDGQLAVVHGCGYDHPSLSHFSSMGFWHTGVPNGGEPLGWLGRLADERYAQSDAQPDRQPRQRRSRSRCAAARTRRSCSTIPRASAARAPTRRRARWQQLSQPRDARRTRRSSSSPSTAHNATESSDFVRQASAGYRTPVDYGIGGGLGGNLQRVAALIAAGMPTRLYYVSYRATRSTPTCSRRTCTAGC